MAPAGPGAPERTPKARLPATFAILLLAVVVAGSAVAFSLPNREPAADGGPVLSRYLPLVDGDASLLERLDANEDGAGGAPVGWETRNTDVLGDGEALLSLTATTFGQLTALYGSIEDDDAPPGLADATVRVERVTTIDESGAVPPEGQIADVIARDAVGDRLLTVTDISGELALDPPALLLPSDLHVGQSWESSGTAGAADYTLEGKVLERTAVEGFDDCLRFEITTTLGERFTSGRTLACAGFGIVARDDLDAEGDVIQHVEIATQGTTRFREDQVPTPAEAEAPPAPVGDLTLGRVGKATPSGSISPPTFPPVFVPTDPPTVVVASERGDVVAMSADSPDVVRWRFHPGGSVYGAPAFDPDLGRLYMGATDKRLYAIDVRGYFLWAVAVDDNVATRPVVSRGVVAFASEAGSAFGVDAQTGASRWRRGLTAATVASPALVDDTVVFGSDDGTIRALGIEDGGDRWTRSAKGSVEAPITADTDGVVYVADAGGGISAIDAVTGDLRWQETRNDAFRTAPALIDELVVVVGESGSVYALNRTDGQVVWELAGTFVGPAAEVGGTIVVATVEGIINEVDAAGTLTQQLSSTDARAPTDPAPTFTLGIATGAGAGWSVDDSAVLRRIGPGAGGLTALQARWVHPFTESPFTGMGFPTTVGEHEGRAVLIDAGGAVYLVEPSTGDIDPIGDDPESPLPAGASAVVDGDQLFMTLGGELRAVDLPSGEVRWSDGSSAFTPNGPIVTGDLVIILRIVTLDDGTITDEVIAHDRLTGEVRWTQRMPFAGSGPALAGDVVIAGSPLSGLDPSDGSILWQVETDRDVVGNAGYDAERDMVVAAVRKFEGDDVLLDLVAADARTGDERWRTPVEGIPEFTEAITVAEDLVVVPQLGGPVVAYDADTGEERWRFAPPAPAVHLGIVTIEDGQVWIITSFAQVFVLDASAGEVVAQSSGFGADVGSFFAPWGQRVRSVDGVFVAPFPPFVAGFDPPEGP